MKFEFFVAARYLRAKRRQAVISVITIISVIGVAAGVASLIVALSINAGFQKDLQNTKVRIYPALFIGHFYKADAKTLNADYLDLEKKLKFDGFGLFAAQSLTDDLIEKLAKRN